VTAPTDVGRALLLELYDAAVAAAAPGPATAAAVTSLQIPRDRRVWIFAIGKAAHPMARAACTSLLNSLNAIVGGIVVSPTAEPSPYPTLVAMTGDHPVPSTNSFAAAANIGELVGGRLANDIALVLISGGASSLIAAPLPGMSESDLIALYELLLGSGLDIHAMNAVRKRFSRWSAGRLALALAPAATRCLAISDVLGDDLTVIGSGPCVADPATVDDVLAILERANLLRRIPDAHRDYLDGVSRRRIPETPRSTHPAFAHVQARVIGNLQLALDGAAERARAHGSDVEIVDAMLAGDASAAGQSIAGHLLSRRQNNDRGAISCCIWGGETTVEVGETRERAAATDGGRCQELALAAARALHEAGNAADGITILAAGTDGRDGATDAAGAVVDSSTWPSIVAAGEDPVAALANHGSFGALRAANAIIQRRETGTNVTDIIIGLIA
jgi:hydroxypyruvate reductase